MAELYTTDHFYQITFIVVLCASLVAGHDQSHYLESWGEIPSQVCVLLKPFTYRTVK